MYKLNIIDNYISVDVLEELEPYLTDEKPWFFGHDTKWSDPNRSLTLSHIMLRPHFTSVEHNFLTKLSRNFDTSDIGRCYYNCFRKYDSPQFHTDPGGCTYMIYLNSEWDESWGVYTEFKLKESDVPRRVESYPGRLVVFDARWIHRGTAPNLNMPDRIAGRMSIAFQCPQYEGN